jgi:8-oxo-dGTP pyrophosphatase MutT (NUDIX family)
VNSHSSQLSQFSGEQLAERLVRRTAGGNGRPSKSFAPELAYGRHRGPARKTSRIAAVAIALFQHDQLGWTIPLTLRPTSLIHHGGQVCFPGGRAERGESMLQAAVREYTEELGVCPVVQQVCGELPTHYVYASDNQVHPVVMVIDPPAQVWQPDPVEVAEVILMPVAALNEQHRRVKAVFRRKVIGTSGEKVGEIKFSAPAIEIRNRDQIYRVWGATAMMLRQLAQLLH